MKQMSSFVLVLIFFTYLNLWSLQENILAVGLVLDTEEYGILDTVKPLVEGGIENFIILNNPKATTATCAIMQNFFKAKGIIPCMVPATICNENEKIDTLIECMKTNFEDIPFIFIPKVGWTIQNIDGLIAFCKQETTESCPRYYMKVIRDKTVERYESCLVRCKNSSVVEDNRSVHTLNIEYEKIPDTIYGEFSSVHYGIVAYKKRLIREKELLLKQYNEGSRDIKTVFNLAQRCDDLGEKDQASRFYEHCLVSPLASEEKFLAAYRLGAMIESYKGKDKDTHAQWSLALYYYLKAHEILPYRAEPFVKIAQHYAVLGNLPMAYFFAQQVLELSYPFEDLLEVERDVYTYVRYDLVGQYAWYVGEFDCGERALKKGLELNPNNEHLQRNLQFYLNRVKNSAIDFVELMSYGPLFNKTFLETDSWAGALKKLYESYTSRDRNLEQPLRIPKIIHQIWLGSELPIRCQALQVSWLAHHPDWEYRLWTDKDIEELGLYNKAAYDAAHTYGEKSDIARYEILYRYGGLYVDTDFECVRSFDRLHHCSDFYAGLENGECLIGNSLIGSEPGHPILKQCIETLQSAQPHETGWEYVCNRTGPGHITRCVKDYVMKKAGAAGNCVLLPVGYFFPWYPYFGQIRTGEQALKSLRPETHAVHHWHSSWVK